MDKVAAVVDLKVVNQGIINKTRMQGINKIILVTVEDNFEVAGAREVKGSKDSKVM